MAPILLVDDDPEVRETLVDLLRFAGFTADTAANGQEALDRLRAGQRPWLILLDLMMPVMNGWEFREKQLSDPALATIPVVVVSAVTSQANGLGCRAVLQKPVRPPDLLAVLRSCDGAALDTRS